MSIPTISSLPKTQSQHTLDRRMRGLMLYLARAIYFILILIILGLSIQGMPSYIASLQAQQGITFRVILSVINTVGQITVSLFIFLRRSDDWLLLLIALTMVLVAGWERTVFYGTISLGVGPLFRFFDSTGSALVILLCCLIPNGIFTPSWTRKFSWFVLLWGIVSFILYLFRENIPWWPQNPNGRDLTSVVWMLLTGVGIYAQIYRFRYISTPIEQQQVKWIVLSIPIALLADLSSLLFRSIHFGNLSPSGLLVIGSFLRDLSFVFLSFSIAFAVYRYKLWDTDFYINRALIYGTVTAVLAGLWWFGAILIQLFINNFIKQESSPMVIALLSGIPAASLFQPLREKTKKWVNTRIYNDQLDFTRAIVELQPENWQFVGLHDMAQTVMKNTARLLKIDKAAIYVFDGETMQLMNSTGVTFDQANQFHEMNISELQKGNVIELSNENLFTTLVPLLVSRGLTNDVIGVLALGPRAQDRGYSRDHIHNLKNLGERAGVAIHFLQLNEKKRTFQTEFSKAK